MNQFKLKGIVYGEPRLYGSGEKTVCKALIKADKSFISITAFRELSRVLYSMNKDEEIEVIGKIQSGSYEKEGKKIYTQDLVVEKFINKDDDIADWMK